MYRFTTHAIRRGGSAAMAPEASLVLARRDRDAGRRTGVARGERSGMDHGQFDALARTMAGDVNTRRAVIRLLVGGVASVLTGTHGSMESAAKQKRASRKHGHHPSRHSASRRQHSKHSQGHGKGKDTHSQGKSKDRHNQGKGKKSHKKRKNPQSPPSPLPPLPPGCQSCNECQMCHDGACVPDPALEGVRCLGSGAACGYCAGGQCAASAAPPCDDGTCPQTGQCCPGEKRCPDPEGPTGFACMGLDDCCHDQKRCASGCVYRQACCPEERPRDCGQCGDICVNGTWQCSAQRPCADGSCVAHDECCDGQKSCGPDTCIPKDVCCPEDPPANCNYPEEQEHCCHGERVCRHQWDSPTCDPYGDWLVYNSVTCTCECPPGSVQVYPDLPWCCPADHPHYALGAVCLRDIQNRDDFVCPLGCHVCGLGGNQCCWPPE
jgi:hypothetical protein